MTTKNSPATKNDETSINKEILNELVTIKRLLIILLTKFGSDSGEIGAALGISPRTVRDLISFKAIKKIADKPDKK